ncbi:MAG: ribosome small subunit-dependent GTPase A [Bacteroidales bacterium]|nr:ribosome small subunit-dependent GTPase A [Bacteroidales bacterium]MBN2755867.1 ribosome small subunit-dependent GTPase A [Bacteroidales bacterium]
MINTGVVIKSTGSWYLVKSGNKITNCKIKGKFRTKGINSTNPVAVGDVVDFLILKEEETGLINKLHDRKNYIIRKSINLSRKSHIIAANIDIAFLIITLKKPRTNTVFIDRFLVSSEAYNIPVCLVFNKIDIYNQSDIEEMENLISLYQKIGYSSIKISAKEKIGIDNFVDLLKNKVSVISGNSGVGKSTLINTINPDFKIRTDEISDYHQKGKHTTTFSEMFELQENTYIIDTPGIKGFGLVDLEKENLSTYFPEMLKLQGKCKFYNCTHTHEPNCAIIKAVENNEVDSSRYKSYLSLLNDDSGKYREDIYK